MKAVITSFLIRALASTWRFSVCGSIPTTPSVLAFWHDEMLPVWKFFAPTRRKSTNPSRHSPLHVSAMTSLSTDGNLLAATLNDWGYNLVRGSSSKGGRKALEAAERLASETLVLITPDGPRGPRHVMKAGAIVAAHRAGVPLTLCRIVAHGKRFRKSWDAFLLPMPFARVEITFSAHFLISTDASREEVEAVRQMAEKWLQSSIADSH
jgi:lysophospholipid acyltransferase (LPLAT)-like uncharacterized protein